MSLSLLSYYHYYFYYYHSIIIIMIIIIIIIIVIILLLKQPLISPAENVLHIKWLFHWGQQIYVFEFKITFQWLQRAWCYGVKRFDPKLHHTVTYILVINF